MRSVITLEKRNTESPRSHWLASFRQLRAQSESICAPLKHEDYQIQSMPDVSPPKWHLAHTSWFFETFLLKPGKARYREFDAGFAYLFNSYYQGLGQPYPRTARGLLSRPSVDEILNYRRYVDAAFTQWSEDASEQEWLHYLPILELGLHHEAQHQELLLSDIKHILFSNPSRPALRPHNPEGRTSTPILRWLAFDAGIEHIGHDTIDFSFDNERPQHRVFLENRALASRLVTNGEYLEFIRSGAYQNPELWLSDAWDLIKREHWNAPLYWEESSGNYQTMSFAGMVPLNEHAPVSHVSYYEADAFARWAGKRLPTEAEWEVAAKNQTIAGNFLEDGVWEPRGSEVNADNCVELFGDVWEWTASAYLPYPGFKPEPGLVGEYNGKFMCNQMVLRGGSCWSPRFHVRSSYRNFFPPATRWQCAGFRLAEDR